MSDVPPASPSPLAPEALPANRTFSAQSPWLNGVAGRCPRCGKGRMFAGLLELASSCEACSLDYAFADTGDGPSFFASFIGGGLVLLAGVVVQVAYEPPWWVYAILLTVGIAFCILLIRPLKGILVALQYVNQAEQGRVEP